MILVLILRPPRINKALPFSTKTESTLDRNVPRRMKRAATARSERVWDYAVIPYEIDANFSGVHKALFKQASNTWHA